MECRAQRLHGALSWGAGRSPLALGAPVGRARCDSTAHGTLWASETRLSPEDKKRLDLIWLPIVDFYFLGIVNGLCRWRMCWNGYILWGQKTRKRSAGMTRRASCSRGRWSALLSGSHHRGLAVGNLEPQERGPETGDVQPGWRGKKW